LSDEERRASQWIVTTIRRAAKVVRRRLYRAFREEPADPASLIFFDAAATGSDPGEGLLLEDILSRLPDLERKVVVLSVLQDVPQREIAARLGLSQPRVSQLRRAALRRLRSILKEGTSGDDERRR
jgi:RNA polymerase sigma factor (sigma-70 family)